MHTPAVSFDKIPGELPNGVALKDVGSSAIAAWVELKLNDLQLDDVAEGACWRDLLAFTETYHTFTGRDSVYTKLQRLRKQVNSSPWKCTGNPTRQAGCGEKCSWTDIDVKYKVVKNGVPGTGSGIVSVLQSPDGVRRIWLFRTWLEAFDGHGHPDQAPAARGTNDTISTTQNDDFDTIVIGGGQAGLSVAGRLHALGLRYLVLEKYADIGDVWHQRYSSLKWHTPKEYGNLPFGPMFKPEDDELVPTHVIGDAHRAWAHKYGIYVRTGSSVDSATYNNGIWTVRAKGSAGAATFKARNLVLAIGSGTSSPVVPEWAAPEKIKASGFTGKVVHSYYYRSCAELVSSGTRGIVVGTANTGHDIAEDMADAGMDTTMIQRGRTFVFPREWLTAAEGRHYNRSTPNEVADREAFTMPMKITREIINYNVHAGIKAHPERFDALEAADFRLDRYGDVYSNIFVRFGGHYIDSGASARIVKGEIKVKSIPIVGLGPDGLIFENGDLLPADLIVLATGYEHNFRAIASKLVGNEVADQMDDYFGLDGEGEIRGYAKKAGCKFTTVLSVPCYTNLSHSPAPLLSWRRYSGCSVVLSIHCSADPGRLSNRKIDLRPVSISSGAHGEHL